MPNFFLRIYVHYVQAPTKNGAKVQFFFHIRKFFLTITQKYYNYAIFN